MIPTHFNLAPVRQPLLTVIIPVYNEKATIERVLCQLLEGPYPDKQIIVVDDGSDDGTSVALDRWTGHPAIIILRHPRNQGKGAAVKTALARAHGVVTVIQDADLEYDPSDMPKLVEPILRGECEASYGSRYLSPCYPLPWTRFRLAVAVMNMLVWILYNQRLTDVATCYKTLRTDLYRRLDLRSERFELCAEITAKLRRLGINIQEAPIAYRPRTRDEGKKIGWRDGWEAIWTLLKWRFVSFHPDGLSESASVGPILSSSTGEGRGRAGASM